MRILIVVLAMVIGICGSVEEALGGNPAFRNVVTIYNHTNVHLDYQLRVLMESSVVDNRKPEWGPWQNYHHSHPNDGWDFRYFNGRVDKIEIRYDKIGGDKHYSEQIYDLEFNVVRRFGELTHKDGRPYCFKFCSCGRHLNLTRHGW